MFESYYWKIELARIEKLLRSRRLPPRRTERNLCLTEREIMVGFFILRRLLELSKVSTRISKAEIPVFSIPTKRAVTRLNSHRLHKNYDWDSEMPTQLSVFDLCNQCIHAHVSELGVADDRNWSDLFVASDYRKPTEVFRVPMSEIQKLFAAAASDDVAEATMTFNRKRGDYDINTN